MTMQPDEIYSTSDFREVVYLLCRDARLVRAIRIGDRKVQFLFADRGTCEGLLANVYYNDQVSLTRALNEIRKARDIIHSTL
jgi:hypothetical protein